MAKSRRVRSRAAKIGQKCQFLTLFDRFAISVAKRVVDGDFIGFFDQNWQKSPFSAILVKKHQKRV